jgi:hypothetical protein
MSTAGRRLSSPNVKRRGRRTSPQMDSDQSSTSRRGMPRWQSTSCLRCASPSNELMWLQRVTTVGGCRIELCAAHILIAFYAALPSRANVKCGWLAELAFKVAPLPTALSAPRLSGTLSLCLSSRTLLPSRSRTPYETIPGDENGSLHFRSSLRPTSCREPAMKLGKQVLLAISDSPRARHVTRSHST